ncbi:MAG TPA: type II secretion system protein GspL [Spongiibacteraceae bacterium]|jgi:general secretion pathway protein L
MRAELPYAIVYWAHPEAALQVGQVPWRLYSSEKKLHVEAEAEEIGIGLQTLRSAWNNSLADRRTGASEQRNIPVTLIIAAEAALITSVTVPSVKPHHVRAAVPNLLEEWTASELDDLHIAFGARDTNGSVPVIAIDHPFLTQCLEAMAKEECSCNSVLVDAQLLPFMPATLTLVVDGQRALLRWSEYHVGAIEVAALTPLLSAILRQGNYQTLQLFVTETSRNFEDEWLPTHFSTLQKTHSIAIEKHLPTTGMLEWLTSQLAVVESRAVNLRQGDFAATMQSRRLWRRWQSVASVATVCLLVQVLVYLGIGMALNHRAQIVHDQSATLYRELFPHDKRLVNIRQQMQTHLGVINGSERASFWELFNALTKELQTLPHDTPVQLRSLTYDANNGALQVELVIPTIALIDTLQKQLSADHFVTKVLSASSENGAIVGRLNMARG